MSWERARAWSDLPNWDEEYLIRLDFYEDNNPLSHNITGVYYLAVYDINSQTLKLARWVDWCDGGYDIETKNIKDQASFDAFVSTAHCWHSGKLKNNLSIDYGFDAVAAMLAGENKQ